MRATLQRVIQTHGPQGCMVSALKALALVVLLPGNLNEWRNWRRVSLRPAFFEQALGIGRDDPAAGSGTCVKALEAGDPFKFQQTGSLESPHHQDSLADRTLPTGPFRRIEIAASNLHGDCRPNDRLDVR